MAVAPIPWNNLDTGDRGYYRVIQNANSANVSYRCINITRISDKRG